MSLSVLQQLALVIVKAVDEYTLRDKKGKGSSYSITERRVPDLIPVLGSKSGLQLPLQPLRRLLPILLLGEHRHNGCEQLA